MNPKTNYLEWVFETLNKRVAAGHKLSDLFVVLPWPEESEMEWDLFTVFNKLTKNQKDAASQGNLLSRDYPALHQIWLKSVKSSEMKVRVFFVQPHRVRSALILNHKKYAYPKVNQLIKTPAFEDVARLNSRVAGVFS